MANNNNSRDEEQKPLLQHQKQVRTSRSDINYDDIIERRLPYRLTSTFGVLCYLIAGGIFYSSLSVCLVHLTILFSQSVGSFYAVYIGQGVGNVCGALMAGHLCERWAFSRQMALLAAIATVADAASPWTGSLQAFAVARAITSFALGYTYTLSSAYLMATWESSGWRAPVLQTRDISTSLGTILAPVLLQSFLSPLSSSSSHPPPTLVIPVNDTGVIDSVVSTSQNTLSSRMVTGTTEPSTSSDDVSEVRFAFLVPASVCFAVFFVFFTVILCHQYSRRRLARTIAASAAAAAESEAAAQGDSLSSSLSKSDAETPSSDRRTGCCTLCLKPPLQLTFTLLAGVQLLLSCGVLSATTNLIMAETVNGLGWTVSAGLHFVTACYSAMLVGRVIAGAASMKIRTSVIIATDLVLALGGFMLIVLPLAAINNQSIATPYFVIGKVLVCLALPNIVAGSQLWAGTLTPLDGSTAAFLNVGICLGHAIGPTVAGVALEQFGYVIFNYMLLGAHCCNCANYCAMFLLDRKLRRFRQYS